MVSLYPQKGELYSRGTSGAASYTKNVVTNLNKSTVVLADYKKNPTVYEEDGILVKRCFKKASPIMWLQVLKEIAKFDKINKVVVQFDFGMYGSLLTAATIIPFLFLNKLMGKKTFVTSHHVITDVFKIRGHVGLGDGKRANLKGNLYNFLFRSFYRLLSLGSKKIIVLEEPLKQMLSQIIPENKIEVVSHGVDTNLQPINKKLARKKLNLNQDNFIIMFFGYVNWFKGSDFFAETFKNTEKILNKKVSTIIAGGESPTMKNKGFYQKYFIKVTKTVADSPVVNMTGYVAQKDLVNYFSAADLVVFPYRHFMTASGVMSLTLSYGKPFIFSNGLGEMFESSDFKKAMSEIGLRKTDISFRLSKRSCLRCAENVLLNGLKAKMSQLARIEREKRNYQNTAYLYKQIVDAETPAFIFGKRWLFHYNKGK